MAQHYIRVDANNIVIKGFTTDFEQPIAGDLPLSGQDERHFHIQLVSPLPRSQFIYKLVNGAMVARTQAELNTEWNARPAPELTEMEQLNLSLIELWESILPILP